MLFFHLKGFNHMHQVNVEEAKSNLPDLIDAAVNGEEVVIAKDDRHAAKLVPVSQARPRPQFGSARGLISMSDDFDEPLEDFAEYMR
jgi:antitoxin (DNA-binding transcriptional repressor) of toxin-antitoxin stability system